MLGGSFIFERSIKMEPLDWCKLGWVCGPAQTGSKRLSILEGVIFPGKGQSFHYHPDQEEVVSFSAAKSSNGLRRRSEFLAQATLSLFRQAWFTPRSTLGTTRRKLLRSSDHASATELKPSMFSATRRGRTLRA